MQWSFNRGLLEYINRRALERTEIFGANIEGYYKVSGNWELLENNRVIIRYIFAATRRNQILDLENWQKIIDHSSIQILKGPSNKTEKRNRSPANRSSSRDTNSNKIIKPKNSQFNNNRPYQPENSIFPPPPNNQISPNNYGYPSFNRSLLPPAGKDLRPSPLSYPSILNSNRKLIVGEYKQDMLEKELKVNNQVIGYLVLPPLDQLTEANDLQFRKKQAHTLMMICGLALLMAIFASGMMARHFVRPIKGMLKVIGELNLGNYQSKLATKGKDELATLGNNINNLAETLQANQANQRQWFSDISHELRTPLAIAKGEIEAMIDNVRPMNKTQLFSLLQEVNHLQRLVDDLHQLSQADLSGLKYHKQLMDIIPLLQQTHQKHVSRFHKKNISCELKLPNEPVIINIDKGRITQLLDNLLDNIVKYANPDALSRITMDSNDNEVTLVIEDSGPGVSEESRNKIFDYLFRVESSRNRKTGGSGLGLAICKKIVEAHRGYISAYASALGGLAIQIKLPKN